MRSHFPAYIDAVLPRHHPIEQCNARRVGSTELLPGGFAIRYRNDFIAPLHQEPLKHPARDGLVIGNQNLHFKTSWTDPQELESSVRPRLRGPQDRLLIVPS